jgi:antagonist of KipI
MEVTILQGGMLTTVQDCGRRGHREAGVPLSGAMDPFALRVANALVGNSEGMAGLEFTLVGPELIFSADALVAVGGAECAGLASWKPVRIRAGETLTIGPCLRGACGYVAVAGGIDIPLVLGSRSTYLRGGFGGWMGRGLRAGDRLPVGSATTSLAPGAVEGVPWRIDPRVLPAYSACPVVRVVAGAQADEFGASGSFYSARWEISPQSDRMGFRLGGHHLKRSGADELLSSAVAPGTIQVPPDGAPIVLMADAQTIGGYPQIAHVIGVDLPLVAQLKPGDHVQFSLVTLAEAHRLMLAREHMFALLKQGLAEKLRPGRFAELPRSVTVQPMGHVS